MQCFQLLGNRKYLTTTMYASLLIQYVGEMQSRRFVLHDLKRHETLCVVLHDLKSHENLCVVLHDLEP